MSFSNFLELELLDQVFGAAVYTPPATLYVALGADAAPDDATFTELSGNGYARVAVTNDKINWSAAASGAVANAVGVSFPFAAGAWSTARCLAVFDAPTNGNQLGVGLLSEAKTAAVDERLRFPAGTLVITLD